jgi:hypothetical protein
MANLSGSQLQGANFGNARQQGAVLNATNLQGANFSNARLQGSSIDHANLQGALLVGAKLQGASIERSQLWGADLSSANLSIANLFESGLQGVRLQFANLQGAIMDGTLIWHASGTPANTTAMRWGGPSYNVGKKQYSQQPLTTKEFSIWQTQITKMYSYHQRQEELESRSNMSSVDPSKSLFDDITPKSVWDHANKSASDLPADLIQSTACETEATYQILRKLSGLSYGYTGSQVRQLINGMKTSNECLGLKGMTTVEFDDIEKEIKQNLDILDEPTEDTTKKSDSRSGQKQNRRSR